MRRNRGFRFQQCPRSNPIDFEEAVELAIARDPRYQPEAYAFVRDALHVAATKFRGDSDDQHVSGQELLEGVREHALREFGPMAWFLLQEWGLSRGENVGCIVYNLIECEYFWQERGRQDRGLRGRLRLEETFTRPFLPAGGVRNNGSTNS